MTTPVEFNFVLVASGNVSTPRLQMMIFAKNADFAKEEAARVACTLSAAGYFHFWLIQQDGSVDENYAEVGRLTVTQAELVAKFIG